MVFVLYRRLLALPSVGIGTLIRFAHSGSSNRDLRSLRASDDACPRPTGSVPPAAADGVETHLTLQPWWMKSAKELARLKSAIYFVMYYKEV